MAKAREAGGAPDGVVTDTVAAGGAAVTAVGTSGAAVAVAEAEAVGGAPAAGQGHAAEVVDGAAVRDTKVPDGGDVLRPHPAEGVATFPRPGELRAADGLSFERLLSPAPAAVVRRSGRDAILPLSAPTVDPDAEPGLRRATVTAPQLRHGGVTLVAGETFAVDFRAYSQLVPIGAIEATPWGQLPDA